MSKKNSRQKIVNRKKRVESKIKAVSDRPRLHVYRSNKYIYGQIIDQNDGKVIAAISEKGATLKGKTKTAKAKELGMQLAKKSIAKKIKQVTFNRGSYRFHGRVRSLAEGAREGGLDF
jgi:large subunit ribosomal protein L18